MQPRGKRPRPRPSTMRRTTSLSELPRDSEPDPRAAAHPLLAAEEPGPSPGMRPQQRQKQMAPLPRNQQRHSGECAAEAAAHFLRECVLCKRRLGAGRDTFMYRGEMAFCSLECRQEQMALDARKEKCSVASASKNPFLAASAAKPPVTTTEAAAI